MRDVASILHVDLDAFFASVEQLHDPSLRGRPVIVGGLGPRGVVAAASYEARRFGVHSAMPMARARRACPSGAFLPPRFEAYAKASAEVHEIFHATTPLVEPIALDEAFLDVAGVARVHGDAVTIATRVRARIHAETGLTASVGVATTKLVAKIASDEAKPDGMCVVVPGAELAFLHPLPIQRLWGVGPATSAKLHRFAVRTIGDLAMLPEQTLVAALGRAQGAHLLALAQNRDDREVVTTRERKSVGQEETFPRDVLDRAELEGEVLRLADRVGARLRADAIESRTIQLKVRMADFRTLTRSKTLPEPTSSSSVIASVARAALDTLEISEGVRLLGVAAQNLSPAAAQQAVLPFPGVGAAARRVRQGSVGRGRARVNIPVGGGGEDQADLRARPSLDAAADAVRRRFGEDALGPAGLMRGGRVRRSRAGSAWGPEDEPAGEAGAPQRPPDP